MMGQINFLSFDFSIQGLCTILLPPWISGYYIEADVSWVRKMFYLDMSYGNKLFTISVPLNILMFDEKAREGSGEREEKILEIMIKSCREIRQVEKFNLKERTKRVLSERRDMRGRETRERRHIRKRGVVTEIEM